MLKLSILCFGIPFISCNSTIILTTVMIVLDLLGLIILPCKDYLCKHSRLLILPDDSELKMFLYANKNTEWFGERSKKM